MKTPDVTTPARHQVVPQLGRHAPTVTSPPPTWSPGEALRTCGVVESELCEEFVLLRFVRDGEVVLGCVVLRDVGDFETPQLRRCNENEAQIREAAKTRLKYISRLAASQ